MVPPRRRGTCFAFADLRGADLAPPRRGGTWIQPGGGGLHEAVERHASVVAAEQMA